MVSSFEKSVWGLKSEVTICHIRLSIRRFYYDTLNSMAKTMLLL